jgi:hypothetical protein
MASKEDIYKDPRDASSHRPSLSYRLGFPRQQDDQSLSLS